MSKVLVDRELLRDSSAELSDWRMSFPDADSGMTDRLVGEIDAILAQPAEAEGVGAVQCPASHPAECYAPGTHVVHASLVHGIVRQADELNAALSALTAERDALRKDAERYRWVSSGLHEAETLVSIVNCHGGYAEKVAERVDVYREAAMAAKEA